MTQHNNCFKVYWLGAVHKLCQCVMWGEADMCGKNSINVHGGLSDRVHMCADRGSKEILSLYIYKILTRKTCNPQGSFGRV